MERTADQNAIELLTEDPEASRPVAIPGPMFPADLGVAKYREGGEQIGLAYLHKFFKRDERGQPLPGTLVRFYVPEHLCRDGQPSQTALDLVAQRMGWNA